MEGYLGETILDIHKTKYVMCTQQDWVMMLNGVPNGETKNYDTRRKPINRRKEKAIKTRN